MAQFQEPQNPVPQEDCTKKRRTIRSIGNTGSCNLSAKFTSNVENPQRLPCSITATISGKWSVWSELHKATARNGTRRRSLWSWNDPKTSETRKKGSILCEMEGISHYRSIVGTGRSLLKRQRHVGTIQTSTPTMTEPAFFSIPLSCFENMKMELAWRFTDLFDQYWSIRENLEDIKLKLLLDDFSEPPTSPVFYSLQTIQLNILQSRLLWTHQLTATLPRPLRFLLLTN